MPATAVTVVKPTTAGVASPTPVAADAVNGNSVPNTAGLILTLNNTGATSRNVVFQTPVTHSGYSVDDLTVAIAAGVTRNFGNFPANAFGRTLTFTAAHAEVTVAAMSTS